MWITFSFIMHAGISDGFLCFKNKAAFNLKQNTTCFKWLENAKFTKLAHLYYFIIHFLRLPYADVLFRLALPH